MSKPRAAKATSPNEKKAKAKGTKPTTVKDRLVGIMNHYKKRGDALYAKDAANLAKLDTHGLHSIIRSYYTATGVRFGTAHLLGGGADAHIGVTDARTELDVCIFEIAMRDAGLLNPDGKPYKKGAVAALATSEELASALVNADDLGEVSITDYFPKPIAVMIDLHAQQKAGRITDHSGDGGDDA